MALMLRADLRNAGLPDTYEGHNLTAHAMRRSFSTWLSEAGVDSHTRDRLMGHAATSTAEKHYTAIILTRLRDAVESIKIDLTTPRVIALPMRSAVGTEPLSELAIDPPQAAGLTAVLTAARGTGEEDWAKTSVIPGAPRRSRTCDLRLRRPSLYPTELVARVIITTTYRHLPAVAVTVSTSAFRFTAFPARSRCPGRRCVYSSVTPVCEWPRIGVRRRRRIDRRLPTERGSAEPACPAQQRRCTTRDRRRETRAPSPLRRDRSACNCRGYRRTAHPRRADR